MKSGFPSQEYPLHKLKTNILWGLACSPISIMSVVGVIEKYKTHFQLFPKKPSTSMHGGGAMNKKFVGNETLGTTKSVQF